MNMRIFCKYTDIIYHAHAIRILIVIHRHCKRETVAKGKILCEETKMDLIFVGIFLEKKEKEVEKIYFFHSFLLTSILFRQKLNSLLYHPSYKEKIGSDG